jgi:predicted secreted Zn-dependent protease
MPEYRETKQSLLLELNSWTSLIHTEDWRAFLRLLKIHQDYLQDQVNSFLVRHEDRRAGEELAKLNDCKKMTNLVQNRINEIRKQLGGQE